jgi:N-acyl-D-amino-acid deacylase
MTQYDLLLRGGVIIDGKGHDRFIGDIAIKDGLIAKIGQIASGQATKVVDVEGRIVSPGLIDLHTHYECQLHWDPYLTPSGWHGMTTVVFGNCGHGLAPCKPETQDRYMRMLETTEQIPYTALKAALSWNWKTFPEFLAHLKAMPKGVNVASFVPMNPLLSYVIGPDEAKRRPATPAERKRMRELLHEAMDAGACGFGFSYLGAEGNSHVDADGSPMPCDVMAEEEAYNLADVLRERGEGVIQVLCELPAGTVRRDVAEELARRSQRPVLHTVTMGVEGAPHIHREILEWLTDTANRGLSIYSQAMTARQWQEFNLLDYNVWDVDPDFRLLSNAKTIAEKVAIARNPELRARVRGSYNADQMAGQTGMSLEKLLLLDAFGAAAFSKYENWYVEDIAADLKQAVTDTVFDIMVETEMRAHFSLEQLANPDYIEEMLRNPRILPGASDGGAHNKIFSGGHWSTDMIVWLCRKTGRFTLEEIHYLLNARTSEVFGLEKRGVLKEGYAADIIVYDFEKLDFMRKRYTVLHDMPNGDWRRTVQVSGIDYVLVNGEITFADGVSTGSTPGLLLANTGHEPGLLLAAE